MGEGSSFFDGSISVRDSSQQKRKKARTQVSMQASFALKGQSQTHECTITDVGTGGVSLVTRTTLYTGDSLNVNFKLGGDSISVPVTVVRASGKNVGAQFDGISQQDLDRIQNYIHKTFFEKDKNKDKSF